MNKNPSMNCPSEPVVRNHLWHARRGGIPKGCLIALAVVLVLLIGGGIVIAMKAKSWMASGIEAGVSALIEDSDLPRTEKDAIRVRITHLMGEWRDGRITLEQVGHVMEEIEGHPMLAASGALVADEKYLTVATLPEEEKAAARRSLQRFQRGVMEGNIPPEAGENVMMGAFVTNAQGEREIKATLTDEELRALVAKAKGHADAANVPDEAYRIDYGAEIDKAIATGLAKPVVK